MIRPVLSWLRILCPLALLALHGTGLPADESAKPTVVARRVDFAAEVLPILRDECVVCHGPSLQMGGLRLDRASFARKGGDSGAVIAPGKSAESLFIQRLQDEKLGVLMPPTGNLSRPKIEALRSWVDQGAAWPEEAVIIVERPVEEVSPTAKAFLGVIRTGDVRLVRRMLADPSLANAKDRYGSTALMHAAHFAGAECFKLLLERGADPNARDRDGATALMWAARDIEKVRLLVERGSDVNARSSQGRTPLVIASAYAGNSEVVRFLLRAGAGAKDTKGRTALQLAARTRDLDLLKTLVDSAQDVNAPQTGEESLDSAIVEAAVTADAPAVRLLLERGAKGKSLDQALVVAAVHGSTEIVRMLVAKGADPNAQLENDLFPQRPLIAAAYSDSLNADVVRFLLEHGADPTVKDARGKTPLDYARERGRTRVVGLLSGAETAASIERRPGPSDRIPPVRQAAQRSLTLLQSSGPTFSSRGGGVCAACHQQSVASLAVGMARTRGLYVDDETARKQLQVPARELESYRGDFLQRVAIPGSTHRIGYLLLGMHAEGYPADEITDAAAIEVAGLQTADGSWDSFAHRPPSEESDFSATAICARVLQLYGPPGLKTETARRIDAARRWLVQAKPESHQDHTFRLLGLKWTGGDPEAVAAAVQELLELQREDGGWGQLPGLATDSYATGLSLYALHEGGALAPSSDDYRRGVKFLLETQRDDGSWHVRSRSYKFQPFFESGFPHGHDQWISAAGTSWAAMALMAALPPPEPGAKPAARVKRL